MADAAPLTLPERQLANEMAVLLAAFMWDRLGGELMDGQIYNIGQSNFEWGCDALNRVGVYKQGKHYTLHHPIVAVSDVRAHMEALEEVDRAAFESLLTALLDNFIDYGSGLSASRQPFDIPVDLHRLAKLLDQCGYATWDGKELQWTDKPAPQMQLRYLWEEDGTCSADLEAQAIEAEAQALIDRMPDVLRRKLRKAHAVGGDFRAIEVMQRHWTGTGWSHIGRREPTGIPLSSQPQHGVRTYKAAFRLLSEEAG